jgi:hypothetical protein
MTGHCTQPNSVVNGFEFAMPAVLEADGLNLWRGGH